MVTTRKRSNALKTTWDEDPEKSVAETANEALRKVSEAQREVLDVAAERGPAAVADLAGFLGSDDALVRLRAAEALAEIGPSAKAAVDALKHALEDEDEYWRVRRSAAFALGRMGGAAMDAVDVLKNAMNDPEESVADSAAEALQVICPEIEMEEAGKSVGA